MTIFASKNELQRACKSASAYESRAVDLIRSADACMADDTSALNIANAIDDFLNEQALLSLSPPPSNGKGAQGLPELSLLRETKILLRYG